MPHPEPNRLTWRRRVRSVWFLPLVSNMSRGYVAGTFAVWGGLCLACAGSDVELEQPVGYSTLAERQFIAAEALSEPPREELDAGAAQIQVAVPADPLTGIRCDLSDTARQAIRFSTGSSALRERGEQILGLLARCMMVEPFVGGRLIVYGYADPRGSEPYNAKLALERALTVRRFLVRFGVDPDRVEVVSVGEKLARGVGPESWFFDRRAEVRVEGAR